MQDKTINNALLALRKQIIRQKGEGLKHVEMLLTMRGVHMPRVMPAKAANTARRGEMQRMVLEAIRDGAKTRPEIVAHVAPLRPDVSAERLYWRVDAALAKLKVKALALRGQR